MIIVKEHTNGNDPLKWNATLYADTKTEATAAATAAALPDGITLEPGSVIYTADLQTGVFKSDNSWEWE